MMDLVESGLDKTKDKEGRILLVRVTFTEVKWCVNYRSYDTFFF